MDTTPSDELREEAQPPRRSSGKILQRRSPIACDVCRSRRKKCDGRKPDCAFCLEHDLLCSYRPAPATGALKLEVDIATIRERLDHISGLLSVRNFENGVGSGTGQAPDALDDYPADENVISRNWRREYPFMTLQTSSLMIFLGLNRKLAAEVAVMERIDRPALYWSNGSLDPTLRLQSSIRIFGAFCDKIHHWYPGLHQEFFSYYAGAILSDMPPNSNSCLVLLVAAIGSVASCASITIALRERPDAFYLEKALSMLSYVQLDFSLRSVQCLLLFSVYYKNLVRPCQAHDFALLASWKAQALLKSQIYDEDSQELELLRRLFWSILLIESELGYHVDMAESNIWKFDDRILLPNLNTNWQPVSQQQWQTYDFSVLSFYPAPHPATAESAKSYFLAQIAMCRMLRRCTTSTTSLYHREVYAPIIASELASQLEIWYTHLPSSIRFDLYSIDNLLEMTSPVADNRSSSSRRPTLAVPEVMMLHLRTQYYYCMTAIYWPAVYTAMRLATVSESMMDDWRHFFDFYACFALSAKESLPHNTIHAWYLCTSLFVTSMVAFESAKSPWLGNVVTPAAMGAVGIAAEAFDRSEAVECSPSLLKLRDIFRDRLRPSDSSAIN